MGVDRQPAHGFFVADLRAPALGPGEEEALAARHESSMTGGLGPVQAELVRLEPNGEPAQVANVLTQGQLPVDLFPRCGGGGEDVVLVNELGRQRLECRRGPRRSTSCARRPCRRIGSLDRQSHGQSRGR